MPLRTRLRPELKALRDQAKRLAERNMNGLSYGAETVSGTVDGRLVEVFVACYRVRSSVRSTARWYVDGRQTTETRLPF